MKNKKHAEAGYAKYEMKVMPLLQSLYLTVDDLFTGCIW
jgi:hypothetical protein